MFFFQFAAVGAYFTFLNVYFRQAGLSGTQIGTLNMTTALIGVGSAVLWGLVADRTGQARLLVAGGAVGALVVNQFIPTVHTFQAFLLLSALGSSLGAAPNTLVDSTALAMLGDRREDYGRYRLGGSIGYILTAFSAGFFYEMVGLRWIFPAYGVFMIAFAAVALLLPGVSVQREGRERGDLRVMMRQPLWVLFTVCIFLVWIAVYASIMFLSVTLQAMGASQSLIGVAGAIPAIAEMPFMLFSGRLMRRYSPARLILVAMVLMLTRFFLLGWMPAPEWALLINILNGPGYVLFWNSALVYVNRMAPPNMAATAQGLLVSTTSLAGVVSSLLTGYLFDQLGPNRLFVVMGFIVVFALLLFGGGNLAWRQRRVMAAAKVPVE